MNNSQRPTVFIEKIMPVKLLNQQVYYEHGGNPFKGLHRWYSRKPLSFSRASVLASLLPDDISVEEFEYLLGLKKRSNSIQKSEQYKDDTKLYKTPPDETRIKQVHDYCEKTWGTRTPTILDAFGGGGSIPFEAARYGLNVLASDLNPVAVVTMKAAMEYPLKFGPDLQQDIDKWVQWVGDEAEKRLAEFFPSLPGEKVQNYLWAHTVVCPSCQSVVPLSPNWWLSKTSNYAGKGQARKATSDWYAVKPIPNPEKKRVDFELIKGSKGKGTTIKTDEGEFDPNDYNVLGDIFPDLYLTELTDKDREAVANPSRFRNMGTSPDELANQDYEAKMALTFAEHYRVLRDDGVMTVQFNHKKSGAWDVLAKSLIDAGFEITASWAVSTENPQNLHQAKKNSVSSTVLLVCRKRDPNAPQAWWDDLQPEVANQVEERAPDFEKNDITGIDLYLSAFGPALNVFSRSYPILDNSGVEVRPEVAFAEARKAIANYRFQKLVQTDTAGFDILTQWYLLAWDAFSAREFPFDEARQLALAIGGFNVNDLVKVHKLLDSTSGTCKLLTPRQRLKKRAFSVTPQDFSSQYLVDDIHAIIAIYQEEENVELVRRFMEKTGLLSNEMFMQTIEVALKVIPDKIEEEQTLMNLCLMMDEIKDNVSTQGKQLELFEQQLSLDFGDI